jgi:hypothetical protein
MAGMPCGKLPVKLTPMVCSAIPLLPLSHSLFGQSGVWYATLPG